MPKSAIFNYMFLEGLKLIGFKLKNFVIDNIWKNRLAATQKKSQKKNDLSGKIIKVWVATFKDMYSSIYCINPNEFLCSTRPSYWVFPSSMVHHRQTCEIFPKPLILWDTVQYNMQHAVRRVLLLCVPVCIIVCINMIHIYTESRGKTE